MTQQQWETVMGNNPNQEHGIERFPRFSRPAILGADIPVTNVSWWDCQEFCQALTRRVKLKVRLPSEAEWEYACRGGTDTPYYSGEAFPPDRANFAGGTLGADDASVPKRTKVRSFPANPFGLYDMYGNVWEWCQDVYHDNYVGAPITGSAWMEEGTQESRVLRGCAAGCFPKVCRSAMRDEHPANEPLLDIGFRVVVEIE